jgi:hypothetical protein
MAAYELTNLGFKSGVRVLKGGFNEWRKSGRCCSVLACSRCDVFVLCCCFQPGPLREKVCRQSLPSRVLRSALCAWGCLSAPSQMSRACSRDRKVAVVDNDVSEDGREESEHE